MPLRRTGSGNPSRFARIGSAAALCGLLALGLAACGHTPSEPADAWGCTAARPTVAPASVARGQQLRIAAPPAHCTRTLPDDAAFTLTVSAGADGARTAFERRAPVASDGSFELRVTIPADFPLGTAAVTVGDADYAPCHDVHVSSGLPDGVVRASCAAPMVQFEVTG